MPEIFNSASIESTASADELLPEDHTLTSDHPISTTPPAAAPVKPKIAAVISRPKNRHKHVDEYSDIMKQEVPSKNSLAAYSPKPLKVFFDSQLNEEEVILLLRQHPITQLKWIITALVLIFLPGVFGYIHLFDFLYGKYLLAGVIGWYLLVLAFCLESFLSWFYNAYIITDERVIDIDFESMIYKNISAAKLDNIEDVTATTGGAIQSIFDFGTIRVQTAAEKQEFEFGNVPHPSKVTTLLNELLLEEEKEKIEGRVN